MFRNTLLATIRQHGIQNPVVIYFLSILQIAVQILWETMLHARTVQLVGI